MIITYHQDSADQIDQHRPYAGKCGQHHPEPAACHTLPDIQADHLPVDLLVPVVLLLLLSEQLYQKLPAYRQCLIQDPVDLVISRLGFICQRPSGLTRTSGRECEQRNNNDPHQGQDPVLLEHGSGSDHQRDHIGKDAGKRVCDHHLDAVDVAGHPGHNIALVIGREKTLGHLLQMGVHLIAHVVCDMLRHPCIDITLRNSYQVCQKGNRQRENDIENQSLQISFDQAFVYDLTGQDRRHQAHERRYRDAQQYQRQLLLIRCQIREYPLQQRRRNLGLAGLLFLCQKCISHRSSRTRTISTRHDNPSCKYDVLF